MYKNTLYLLLALTLLMSGCKPKTWVITSETGQAIPIDKTTNAIADTTYLAYLAPYKKAIDDKMNIVIGQAAQTLKGHGPESLLSNLSADIYKQSASKYLGKPVDMAIVNLGGLRTAIPEGDITLRKVFELMPFENELVILWLRGDKLYDLLQFFAQVGGEGESGVRMVINNKKAENITIDGQPLDKNKLYSIATNDYLAGGNDKMVQLAMAEKKQETGIKVRNMLLEYIQSETAAGRKIDGKLDGRITIKND